MLIAQLFLVVSISVATANVFVDSEIQSLSAALQVECGGKICKNGATCKTGNICDCKSGTKGDECEVVVGCDKLKEKCDKINTECIYNTYLSTATCKCSDEKKRFNGSSCVDCDCGEHVRSCEYTYRGKACFCEKGYADKFGTCSLCSCGAPELEKLCAFAKGKELCLCKEGSSKKNGICTDCTCGADTKSCYFDDSSKKQCICKEGYDLKLGTCTECNCGENSTYCYYYNETADKRCSCTDGNADKLGTCTHCDCGPDTSCSFNSSSGEKECLCLGELCREPPTPWNRNPVVIVCIVALVGIVVSIGGFVAYRKLRRN